MFGNNQQQANDQNQTTSQDGTLGPVVAPPEPSGDDAQSNNPQDAARQDSPGILPGNLTASEPTADTSAAPAAPTTAPVASGTGDSATTDSHGNNDHLLALKQDALAQLSPLVEHLDQSPEERFRTIMMMIQATDDHTKIQEAYDAAKEITDDKVRAQALLDIVNEINYFTQNHKDQ